MSTSNTKLKGNTAYQNSSDSAKGSGAVSRLHAGSMYPGVVESVDLTTGMLTVIVKGMRVDNVRYMASISASFIGVREITLPPPSTGVLVWYWPTGSYAMGMQDRLEDDGEGGCVPPATGNTDYDVMDKGDALALKAKKDKRPLSSAYRLPLDMLPGEWGMDTGIGPVFRLLYNFAQMAAGDLAKIEVHLVNDMVRIVSNEFRHHHVAGDDLIWSDGWHNTKEYHVSSYCFEAEGKQEESSTFAEQEEEGMYKGPTEDEDPNMFKATGRWRYSTYIGFLGDMIHTWITRPTEVLSNTMDNAFRGSNFRQWIGQDGTFFIQSGMAVQIEVNPHQVVPAMKKSHNDPEFNPQDQKQELVSLFLKIWGNGPDWKDLKVSCWQMRYYLKYIPLWHSLERFKQVEYNDYCRIPTEEEAPEFKPNAGEEDKEQENSSADGDPSPSGYASFTMDITGNISLVSNDHTSVIMSNGSIQIACPGNLELKAGGTISLQGRDMILHSAKDIEFMSFFGGIYTKARTCLHYLCEKGRIWLKSDAEEDNTDAGNYPLSDMEQPEVQMKKYGVILDAPQSKVLACGGTGVDMVSTEEEGHIVIQASGRESDIKISSTQYVTIKSVKEMFLKCIGLCVGAVRTKFTGFIVKFGKNVIIKGGSIMAKGVAHVMSVISKGGYIGPNKFNGEQEDVEEPDVEDEDADALESTMEENITPEVLKSKYKEDEFDDSDWKLPEWNNYHGDDVMSPFSYKGSMMDDYAIQANAADMDILDFGDVHLLAARRTSMENYPWPGIDGKLFLCQPGTSRLTEKWSRHFQEEDIGGEKFLHPQQYQYVFSNPDLFPEDA